MSELNDDYDFAFENYILTAKKFRAERRREIISCLTEIAAEVTAALNDTGLSIPICFFVPSSGEAVATFAMAGDPCEEDRQRACDIITRTVGRRLEIEGLRTSALTCIAAGVHMGAADIIFASDDRRPELEPNR